MHLAKVLQIKLFRQARSPYMDNLMQLEGKCLYKVGIQPF